MEYNRSWLIKTVVLVLPLLSNIREILSSSDNSLPPTYTSATLQQSTPESNLTDLNVTYADTSTSSSSVSPSSTTTSVTPTDNPNYITKCPDNVLCHNLGGDCVECQFNKYCSYGSRPNTTCQVKSGINCIGDRSFSIQYECRYCYQLEESLYNCNNSNATCQVRASPRNYYTSQCTVKDSVICMGKRTFYKKFLCNWTSGYKWSTALLLSVTLGGFGVDRFYLGLWREGIGKLFSFGGLGVWTLVDVILIAIGYIGPADGSLYI